MRVSLNHNDLGRLGLSVIFTPNDACCSPSLFAVVRIVHHLRPITEYAKPFAFDDRKVCEDILAVRADYEAESFARIEPLDDAFSVSNFLRLFIHHRIPQRDSVTPSRVTTVLTQPLFPCD